MEQHLEWIHCLADDEFYDAPDRMRDHDSRFDAANRDAPDGWLRGEADLWVGLEPAAGRGPRQGWKMHVSVTLDDAPGCLDLVWEYCVANELAFKFLRSLDAMVVLNAKYAGRGSSGKLVTFYPRDEQQFEKAITDLSVLLDGMPGPYVLGDLRIGAGPLYVRYGAFTQMWCPGEDDEPVLAIENADGELVPDRRGPVFQVPPWVELPQILKPHLEARHAGGPIDFPYRVEEALHFSNAGGVYLARDAAGEKVVLREARPYAGLDRNHEDAVARLRREHRTLTRLAGLGCVPAVHDYRIVQGHHFLVEEYIEGPTLLRAVQTRGPALFPDTPAETNAAELAEYRRWVLDVLDRVEAALDDIHARGIRFGDLHPSNVLLGPGGRVVLIDFEFAAELDDDRPPGLGAPGFAAPAGLTGAAIDDFALDSLRVFPFMMLTPLLDRTRAKAGTLVEEATGTMGMPARFGAALLRTYEVPEGLDEAARWFAGADPSWPRIRDSIVAGIHAAATPERDDRLFPGSPAQLGTGGFDLSYGSAGVLFALHRVGAPIPAEYLRWTARAVERAQPRPAQGLFNGPHGAAAVFAALGRRDEALAALEVARRFDRLPTSDTLAAGRAGRALNLLGLARLTGDDAVRAEGLRTAVEIGRRVEAGTAALPGHGLLRGPSGAALLFIRAYEQTGEDRYLDWARRALEQDLDVGQTRDDGSFQLAVGSKHLPYLDGGSGGVALVLHEYQRHRDDTDVWHLLTGIRLACKAPTVYQSGLFTGRAGFIAVLARLGHDEDRAAIGQHVRRLGWHALLRGGDLVFPGDQLLRLSLDLATGSAGVLLALRAAFDGATGVLPYLDHRV
ncbi:class III lanthionine synthetase LanKC [Actinoplanes sp. L3-i22]|uniref:class III lanthionine synthetase LanKC n=1 Tax=Actinoplanes sp. L3-i22 TaxID=2836373 RepID=UPI001C784739|nr:class III lanthionine synthetase LanKC [Actinoplanes sp. L3-i22]BCY11711.1 serine/threonine protein kinase [Actinoplanes sp. L3-i22]